MLLLSGCGSGVMIVVDVAVVVAVVAAVVVVVVVAVAWRRGPIRFMHTHCDFWYNCFAYSNQFWFETRLDALYISLTCNILQCELSAGTFFFSNDAMHAFFLHLCSIKSLCSIFVLLRTCCPGST